MSLFNCLLIGIILIIISIPLALIHQNSITGIGFKTPLAMKNVDTWNEANRFSGILFGISGVISLILGFLAYKEVLDLLVSQFVGIALLLISMLLTTVHLHKTFDSEGKRK